MEETDATRSELIACIKQAIATDRPVVDIVPRSLSDKYAQHDRERQNAMQVAKGYGDFWRSQPGKLYKPDAEMEWWADTLKFARPGVQSGSEEEDDDEDD